MAAIFIWHVATTWGFYILFFSIMSPPPLLSLLFSFFQSNEWPHQSKYFVYLSLLLVFSATPRLLSNTRYNIPAFIFHIQTLSRVCLYKALSLLPLLLFFYEVECLYSKSCSPWYLLVIITTLTLGFLDQHKRHRFNHIFIWCLGQTWSRSIERNCIYCHLRRTSTQCYINENVSLIECSCAIMSITVYCFLIIPYRS